MATDRDDVEAALTAVHRERYKATLVTAVADAVVALLVVNLALSVLVVDALPETIGPVATSTAASVTTGVVVLATSTIVNVRRFSLERFEAANPNLEAAVRTARDVLSSDGDGTMARLLYGDLVDRLGEASSQQLLRARWLAARLVVVLVVSLLTLQVAVAGLTVDPLPAQNTPGDGGAGQSPGGGGSPNPQTPGQEGLQSGDDVLGDPQDVPEGSDPLDSNVSGGPGGDGDRSPASYDRQGLTAGDDGIETQRSGFDDPGEVEDADLIREYTLRVTRNETDE
ncbi:DUF7502 family protein [Haloarcula pelagica]|uniref:DUF7502 family protein n=1 Tax=Haloarcula pelagica TaxID=3033389 RepID=UPI0024C3D844|nr:hypothetical protein [Halomicroarcula sp. YJ-61-S]